MLDSGFRHRGRVPVGTIQVREISRDALLELLHPRLELALREILVTVVDCLELAAVDGHERLGEKIEAPAQDHELPTDALDGVAVVLAEVGERLEVR